MKDVAALIFVLFQFYVLLASVFVMELGVGLVGYTLQSQIGHMLVTTLNNTLTEYGTDPTATDAIDDLQYGVNIHEGHIPLFFFL